ncbi:MAG: universal stress protein, partial [Actinomycetota bacterium]
VWSVPTVIYAATPVPPSVPDDAKEAARRVVSTMLDELGPLTEEVDVETVVAEGDPASILVEESKDADLLVVGSRGHGGFAELVLGSVSAHCAHHACCPVVIVRHFDRGR